MRQRSFANADYAMKKKRTRREEFLAKMGHVVPWARLTVLIEPLYPTSLRVGRQLTKHTTQLFSLFGLANPMIAKRSLAALYVRGAS